MEIRVPQLAEGVESATVVNILISEGDQIQKDQVILELETEKAVGPVPSPGSGKVSKIHVSEGDVVNVGQALITLSEEDAEKPSDARAEKEEAKGPEEGGTEEAEEEGEKEPERDAEKEAEEKAKPAEQKPGPREERRAESKSGLGAPASPSIRKIAHRLGIDLSRVRGSERGGRITLKDVRDYIQRLQQLSLAEKADSKKAERPAPKKVDFSKWGAVDRKPMSSVRRAVSQRMVESWTTVPHITQFDNADVTSLMELRKKYNRRNEKRGVHLTLTAFALHAVAGALKKYPVFNSSFDESTGEIVYKNYIHIGVAVDTEAGLIVPVLKDVDKKSFLENAKELNELVEKTRKRKVSLEELQGGSFTISNQGNLGGTHFTPIINKPEVAILGLGQASRMPLAGNKKKKLELRMVLPVCLSYDHRVIDGADAVLFLREIVQSLEKFSEKNLKA